jgi:4'-phosphopantetheinyl transferase EntD
LERLPRRQAARAAKAVFSAKETLFKCQFTVSHAWVGFESAEIEFAHDPLADEGAFRATLLGGGGEVLAPGWAAEGRFARVNGYILTTIALR